jgi:hypothetical protein
VAAASGTASGALIDEETGNRVGALIRFRNAELLRGLALTKDERYVVQVNNDGSFFVYNVSDGELLLNGAYIDEEVVVLTPDGRYDTSYEGAETLQVSFRGLTGLQTIHQFKSALYRPGLAADVLAGTPVPSRPASIGAPPTLELEIDKKPVDGKVRGRIAARSQTGLDRIHVHLDGRLVEDRAASGSTAEVEFEIPDPGGGHWITAVAYDRDGLASRPLVRSLPPPVRPRGTLRAVLVGIGEYEDPAISRLPGPPLDVKTLDAALQATKGNLVADAAVTSLIDREATQDAILAAIDQVVAETEPDDTAVLFFAGHGDTAGSGDESQLVLALTSTDTDRLATTSLPWSRIASAISGARGKVVVILDACQAGLAGKESFAANDRFADALRTSSNAPIIVLAASKGIQTAGGSPSGGWFTLAIAAAINNRNATDTDRNGIIDVSELYAAVKAAVVSQAQEQTPWLARNALFGKIALF